MFNISPEFMQDLSRPGSAFDLADTAGAQTMRIKNPRLAAVSIRFLLEWIRDPEVYSGVENGQIPRSGADVPMHNHAMACRGTD